MSFSNEAFDIRKSKREHRDVQKWGRSIYNAAPPTLLGFAQHCMPVGSAVCFGASVSLGPLQDKQLRMGFMPLYICANIPALF